MHGRLITDNVIVAFETMHHISQKKGGKIGEMSLKLDMSKAYDRMEWTCLDKIMEKLGFVEYWRKLIMRCVTTISYAININGWPKGHIIPTRVIRQGDLLSPYLFLLCVEGLSALIKSSVDSGFLEGIAVCRGGPKLSHLFFANGSLIFCKATLANCESLQRILEVYECRHLIFTHDLIKENDLNDHSCTPKIIIALHASICSCITCINSFIAYHENDLEVLTVTTMCSISKLDHGIERYHMIKFARSACIV